MDNSKLNLHFQNLEVDYLYHLGLDSSMDLKTQFSDIKFVVLTRAISDADYFANQFTHDYYKLNQVQVICKTIGKEERYHIYKVGNTLVISHGIGFPSMLICLNEVVKLLWHAGVTDYTFIRLSQGGGIGVATDNIVIANHALNQQLKAEWTNLEFGETYSYSTIVNDNTSNALINANPNRQLTHGKILSTNSFYNGQARLNGALAVSYTDEQRNAYLHKAYNLGARGIDMESSCFLGFCQQFTIPATVVLAIVTDRLKNKDSIKHSLTINESPIETNIQLATSLIINYILTATTQDRS